MKEKKNPLISVVVPVYNAENYLDGCIQSIMEQSYENWELLLVDDGSLDQSGVICDTWAQEDKRITVLHEKNGGAAFARNQGVKAAKGEYIAFVDSDDLMEKNYLDYLISMALQYGAQIAVCGYRKVFPENSKRDFFETKLPWKLPNFYPKETRKKKVRQPMEEKMAFSGEEAMQQLLYQNYFMSVPWGMISEKNLWREVAFPEGTKAEDMGTIYKLFSKAGKVVYGSKPLYQYFQRADNTMFSTSRERNKDYYKHSREMVSYVKKNYPQCLLAARSRHFSACFQILSETPKNKKYQGFYQKIYEDIRKMQNHVLRDKKAKIRNRGAALLSLVSIDLLHVLLRGYYGIIKLKVSGKSE